LQIVPITAAKYLQIKNLPAARLNFPGLALLTAQASGSET
jgi:hypothetical protein